MYKFETANELELCRRITELHGEINRLNTIFEHNRKLNNHIVAALQSGDTSPLLDLVKNDTHPSR